MRLPALRVVAVAAAAAALLPAAVGCSSSAAPAPRPSASPHVVTPAWRTLAALAARGAGEQYTAVYRLAVAHHPATQRVTVYRGGAGTRIDLTARGYTAVLLVTARGSFSCLLGARRTCFIVAPHGRALPAMFDPGLEHLLSGDLRRLAATASTYTVRVVGRSAARASVPASTCFAVHPGARTPAPAAPAGIYCFSALGVPTLLDLASGQLVMTALAGSPRARSLTPPVSPTPLPR